MLKFKLREVAYCCAGLRQAVELFHTHYLWINGDSLGIKVRSATTDQYHFIKYCPYCGKEL